MVAVGWQIQEIWKIYKRNSVKANREKAMLSKPSYITGLRWLLIIPTSNNVCFYLCTIRWQPFSLRVWHWPPWNAWKWQTPLWFIFNEMVTPVLPAIMDRGISQHLNRGKLMICQSLLVLLQKKLKYSNIVRNMGENTYQRDTAKMPHLLRFSLETEWKSKQPYHL